MHKNINKKWLYRLWENYSENLPIVDYLIAVLRAEGASLVIDHVAFIDLPGPRSGIPFLERILALLGFSLRGQDYLAEKQNSFAWLAEENCAEKLAHQVLPQIVIADFEKNALNEETREIIDKYSSYATPLPLEAIKNWVHELKNNNEVAEASLIKWLMVYFKGREWPLPSYKEYQCVKEKNELLAWVLIFGRVPNHFTLAVHHMRIFKNLNEFNHWAQAIGIEFNQQGGIIKGDSFSGIAQSAMRAPLISISLEGGVIEIPSFFLEFIWRFPNTQASSYHWQDYYTGFIGRQADRVVESLYKEKVSL